MHVAGIEHRARPNAGRLQRMHRIEFRDAQGPRGDDRIDLVVVPHPRVVCGVTRIVRQLRPADGPAQPGPFLIVLHRHDTPTVVSGTTITALRRQPWMAIADPFTQAPVSFPIEDGIGNHVAAKLIHGDIDPNSLAEAVAIAHPQRRPHDQSPSREEIDEGLAHFHRYVARVSGDMRQSMRCFHRGRLPGVWSIWPLSPITTAGQHDQFGIEFCRIGIIQPPAAHDPRREVLRQDIAYPDQVAQDLTSGGLSQIEGERFFTAVQQIVRGGAVPWVFAHLIVRVRRREIPASRGVEPPGAFDLDHLRPKVGQKTASIGQREYVADIDHAQPRERKPRFLIVVLGVFRHFVATLIMLCTRNVRIAPGYSSCSNISALCCPRRGAGLRYAAPPALMFHMRKGTRILPITG